MLPIPTEVKIPSLLAEYFYSKQRLELPGIGIFTVDDSSLQSLQTTKQRTAVLEGTQFESKLSAKETPELISFIAEKTGKMKALASSDLSSHLELAMQFLNMGKPYLFEGIGILTKAKAGEFEFTPVAVSMELLREHTTASVTTNASKEEKPDKYDSFLTAPKTNFEWKKPVIAGILLCGLGFAVWGGYVISQKNKKNKPVSTEQMAAVMETLPVDTMAIKDTVTQIDQATLRPDTAFKYVLEVAKSKRAFKRYNQLREINWKVQLETQDSVQYKLFMVLPSIDTAKTMDSLTAMTGRRVYIEYAN
ncbi:MAG: hypothetical protein EOO01_25965 [Chitinophagaceae bacterium]|nr:MAG: hypothetical protein EOO01_25965 [Chitinophagaceae bacterium]